LPVIKQQAALFSYREKPFDVNVILIFLSACADYGRLSKGRVVLPCLPGG
jgi:hypothetical protein